MDEITTQRLAEVHPVLAERVGKLIAFCENNSLPVRVTTGLRSYDEQNALFDQGRALPGHIVTNASGGHSAHQFGYAVDIDPGQEGFPTFTPDWNTMDPQWQRILTMAGSYGLGEGAQWRTFKDMPHLYLIELPADPTDEMRNAYDSGGMTAVWKHFAEKYGVHFEETA